MSRKNLIGYSLALGVGLMMVSEYLNLCLGGGWDDLAFNYKPAARAVFFAGVLVAPLGFLIARFRR